MAVMPGPRTRPTVKPLATMNKRNLQHWELRLGLVQLVIFLGIVTGSMACAFYLGFSSGRSVGFESALERSIANSTRLPVIGEGLPQKDDSSSEVYAKLSQPANLEEDKANPDEQVIPLDSIKTTDAAPIKDAAEVKGTEDKIKNDSGSALGVGSVFKSSGADAGKAHEILNDGAKENKPKGTLGDLIKGKSQASTESAVIPEKVKVKESLPVKAATTTTLKAESKPEVKAVPKEKSNSLVRDVIPAGWYAQVAAPKKMQDATALSSKLKASGFAVMIEVARVRGEEYYRILVGPEQNRAQAERLVGQVKRESYLPGSPFLRVVK